MARRRGQRSGHLYQKSGFWMLRYRVDTLDIDPVTLEPIRDRIAVQVAASEGPQKVGKREAARIAWEEYLSKIDQSSARPGSMRTLADFVSERFTPDVVAQLKPSGQAHYTFILRKHVLPALGQMKLRDIATVQIQVMINSKLKAGLSAQTCLHIKNAVSAILRHAKSMQWFAGELPTEYVRLPEMKTKECKALTWAQVCQLSNALPEPIATLVPFLALTGLRIGEAMGLRWKYVNLTDQFRIVGSEVIPPMCVAVRENFVMNAYQSLKTAKSSRNVPIADWFAPRLLSLFGLAKWQAPEDPMFAAECGRPIDRHNTSNRILKPAAKALGLGWASWHNLRHTSATLADQGGFSVTERQRILGHATQAMTQHYSHAEMGQMRERLEAMVDKKLLN